MKTSYVAWVCAIALLFCASPVRSLFEEQAGQNDWYLPMVGRVSLAKFALRGRTRLFVASDEAVVACLDARNGGMLWRQVLPQGDVVGQMALLQRPAALVTWSATSRQAALCCRRMLHGVANSWLHSSAQQKAPHSGPHVGDVIQLLLGQSQHGSEARGSWQAAAYC